jgi:signal transduction histidine kinase
MGNAVPVAEGQFAVNSPFLQTLRQRQTSVFQREVMGNGDYADLTAEERGWLGALAMVIYIPILSGGQLTGILALGNAALGYGAHELAVLRTLAHQTAATLYHTQVYADLKALNEEITALNRELHETNERLKRVDAAKTDFIAIASHELRTPLTQVRGYADLLAAMSSQGRPGPDQVATVVANIGRATQRLEDMVAAMLDASQIDIDALKLYYTETTMEAALWQCLERMAEALRERRHVLLMRGISVLPPLRVDAQRLTQALCNVIGNAIKYTPDGGRITVTGQRVNGDRVEIVIADTGVGIDRDHLDLIFEKFYRASRSLLHSSSTTKFMGGGPGLGLRIAKGVIEAHGGRIWAESAGHDPVNLPGSAFHIILPLQPPGIEPTSFRSS